MKVNTQAVDDVLRFQSTQLSIKTYVYTVVNLASEQNCGIKAALHKQHIKSAATLTFVEIIQSNTTIDASETQ